MLAFLLAVTAILAQAGKVVGPSGEGAGVAGGYMVSEIKYTLLASDPSHLDGVTFNLTAADGSGVPSKVSASVDGGEHWTTCQPASDLRWTCSLRDSVRELTSLRVVAVR